MHLVLNDEAVLQQSNNASSPSRIAILAVPAVAGTAAVLYRFGVAAIPPCPFRYATGCWCPGCGTGRSLTSLVRGNVLGAFRYNALMMVFLPLLMVAWARAVFPRVRRSIPDLLPPASVVLIAVLAWFVIRNVPALSVLRPA